MAENPAAFDVLKLSVAIQYLLLLSTKNQEETVRSKSRKIRFQPGRLNSVQRSGALLPSKRSKLEVAEERANPFLATICTFDLHP